MPTPPPTTAQPVARRTTRIARRIALAALVLALLGVASIGLTRCGGSEPKPGEPPPVVRSSPKSVTFTQIMLLYKRDKSVPTVTRSKEEALVLARTLIERIRTGESMETLVAQYTDDRGPDGKPFNSGSYSMARKNPAVESIKSTAFGLDVKKLAPEPVDSGYAYHVIRRDH